jgi:hypothetical protein
MACTTFCYYCRSYHPSDEMTFIEAIGRWRCRRSIALSRRNRVERDAFGKRVTELNKARRARPLPHCILKLLA